MQAVNDESKVRHPANPSIEMYLNRAQIIEYLETGKLALDPAPDPESIGDCAVDLHLGTSFAAFEDFSSSDLLLSSVDAEPPPLRPFEVALGQRVEVQPITALLAVTLEYVRLPWDLSGLVMGRGSWSRFGLTCVSTSVSPGFEGKLVITLQNISSQPLALYPGVRVALMNLAKVDGIKTRYAGRYSPATSPFDPHHLSRLKKLLDRDLPKVVEGAQRGELALLLDNSVRATGSRKGKLLEQFVATVIRQTTGLKIIKSNARLKAEELDIIVYNRAASGFLRWAGSPIVVECKNWSKKVGAKEIALLSDKLAALGPSAMTGILVAPEGVTGTRNRDALLKLREQRQRGKNILVVEERDLAALAAGASLVGVLERLYEQLLLI